MRRELKVRAQASTAWPWAHETRAVLASTKARAALALAATLFVAGCGGGGGGGEATTPLSSNAITTGTSASGHALGSSTASTSTSVAPWSSFIAANPGDANNLQWGFNSGGETFAYLGAGQSLTLTYTVRVSDGTAIADQQVVVTITGSNNAPAIAVAAGDSAAANLVEANAALSTGGTLSVTDADVTDMVSPSVVSVVASGATSGLSSDNAALLSMLTTTSTRPPVGNNFVRPAGAARLLGMNIGAKNYDDPTYQAQLARLDVAILGFYPGWRGDTDGSLIRRAVQAMKALNPGLKVGQYTMLNEASDQTTNSANADLALKLNAMNWWLRDATTGAKTQWTTSYGAYDINPTGWTAPDANGDRWPQWLARRDNAVFFQRVPEFDLWYFDNVMTNSRVAAANWKLDGTNWSSQDPTVAASYRNANAAHWQTAAALAPGRIQMGNTDSDLSLPEYKGKLGGAFLEGLMGKSWSIETWGGWPAMMKLYFDTNANLKSPALLGFNAQGSPTDWRFFRYAFASCLLGNGYFSFTDASKGYSSVPWFDEYEVALGTAQDAPTLTAWSNGVYRRRFQHAMVLVNPQSDARTVVVEPGWRRLFALQDPATNNGQAVSTLTLPSKDGLILVRM